ncbi:MAG: SRPBCC domain-containing protein [Candidatus Dormibacteria bacterium]
MSNQLEHTYRVVIQTTPRQVWDALTTSKFTTQYYFGLSAESDWRSGSPYVMTRRGETAFDGTVVHSEPSRRLLQTVNVKFLPMTNQEELTIQWDIEPLGEACSVAITHKGSSVDAELFAQVTAACPELLCGLKTLLESGRSLRMERPATVAVTTDVV